MLSVKRLDVITVDSKAISKRCFLNNLKVIASPGNRASEVAGMEQSCDHVGLLIAAVLRLCEVERRASDAGNLFAYTNHPLIQSKFLTRFETSFNF